MIPFALPKRTANHILNGAVPLKMAGVTIRIEELPENDARKFENVH